MPSNVRCNVTVAAVGGHWSESYREDGLYSGTLIWTEAKYPFASIQDATKLFNAQLNKDLGKLIQMGVASDVKVETKYVGTNRVEVTITVVGTRFGEAILNLTSEKVTNR